MADRQDMLRSVAVKRRDAIKTVGAALVVGSVSVSAQAREKSPPRCAVCWSQGRRHKVFLSPSYTVTLMRVKPGYWDEDGVWHPPCDPNHRTFHYSCSNGHQWSEKIKPDCG